MPRESGLPTGDSNHREGSMSELQLAMTRPGDFAADLAPLASLRPEAGKRETRSREISQEIELI